MTERPKMNKEPDYLAAKLRRVHDPDVRPLNELVERWRQEGRQVPYADPDSCGVRSRVLFLHESPGPQASAHGSGLVSTDNNDPSAERFWRMASLDGGSMAQLGLPRRATDRDQPGRNRRHAAARLVQVRPLIGHARIRRSRWGAAAINSNDADAAADAELPISGNCGLCSTALMGMSDSA